MSSKKRSKLKIIRQEKTGTTFHAMWPSVVVYISEKKVIHKRMENLPSVIQIILTVSLLP